MIKLSCMEKLYLSLCFWICRTALHIACVHGHTEVVQYLVENKVKLNLCDNQNRSALMKVWPDVYMYVNVFLNARVSVAVIKNVLHHCNPKLDGSFCFSPRALTIKKRTIFTQCVSLNVFVGCSVGLGRLCSASRIAVCPSFWSMRQIPTWWISTGTQRCTWLPASPRYLWHWTSLNMRRTSMPRTRWSHNRVFTSPFHLAFHLALSLHHRWGIHFC